MTVTDKTSRINFHYCFCVCSMNMHYFIINCTLTSLFMVEITQIKEGSVIRLNKN